jgi:hypothetical protein
MAAICFAANTQQWSVSTRNLIGDEPHDKPDSRFVGYIGIRPVDDSAVMQGHLSRLQDDIYRLRFINVHCDSLAAPV